MGIAGIGRVVTTAALVMSISFAALIPAHVSFMRMLGLGLTLAVLADATLVRMVLVPVFIHLLGRWTWWAPSWLARSRRRAATPPPPPAHIDPEKVTTSVDDGG